MAQIQRLYDFQAGTRAMSQQVDDELNQLVNAHNTLDTDVTNHKSSGDHDGRYYTKTQLDSGQLDDRYYTETELNNGALDGRYYTETELNNGQLDNRYYTETELSGSGGASKIGITPISGLTAINTQQALEGLNNKINQTALGQVPDGSITPQKLSFDPATQAELDTHLADTTSHITSAERTSWNAAQAKANDLEILYWMGAM